MYKLITTIAIIFMSLAARAQNPHEENFKHPAQYKLEWQRLLLKLSFSYYTAVKDGQVDFDNSLLYTSHSLGLSRLPLIAEGIDDPELLAKSQWVDKREPRAGIKMLSGLDGKQHLELLVLIGAYYAFEPDSYHNCKDSVLYYLNRAITESKTLHDQSFERIALCLLGKMYAQANDTKADAIFNKLIKECHAAGDVTTEARAWAYRGLYTAYSPASMPNRKLYLQKATGLYHSQGDTEGEIFALTYTCYLNVASGKLKEAHDAAIKALELAESIHFPYTHYNTDAIAMVGVFNNEFGEPLKYALETVRTAEATRDSIGWGYFYSKLETLYDTDHNSSQESINWGKKSLYRFLAVKEASYLNLSNLVSALLDDNRPKEAFDLINLVARTTPPVTPSDKLFYYLALEDYYLYQDASHLNMAESYLLKADSVEKQIEKTGITFRALMITYKFGQFYFKKSEYPKAKHYFKQYLANLSNQSDLSLETSSLIYLIKIDSSLNDRDAELQDWKQYSRLSDSSFTIAKIRQGVELNIKYATEEKENQIALLNKDKNLEQANLKQAGLVEEVTIGGVVLVLFIAGLLYRQSRLRKKNNELITHKNEVITHKNELLQSLVTEKEWLLKEVHQRVKNNLHTVICLLESQAAYLENDALEAIEKSQHRIYTMSLIHQKLYQSDDVKTIDMAIYVPELVQYLGDSFDISKRIHFNLMIDPIQLNASQAIPLALLMNEALTNSIKYAFPGNRRGEISIALTDTGEQYKLELADNGIGFVEKEKKETNSLGLELMKGLAKEITGTINIENNDGVKITVLFDHDALNDMEVVEVDYLTSQPGEINL